MELVAEKYKITEVGKIPSDWEVKELGEIGSFKKGRGIKKSEVLLSGISCVRYGELYTHHNEYVKKINSFISEETAKQSQKISIGDILFAGSGETKEEIGKCAAFLIDNNTYAGGDVIIFTPIDCNSLFLGFLLNDKIIARQKAQIGQGDAVVHIYSNGLAKVKIPLPPTKAEQTAIATALSDADNYISSLEKLIAKKQAIKQGAMQQLLTPKEHWVVKKLGDFLDYKQPTNYIVSDTEYNDNNQTPVLTAGKTFILGYTDEEFGIFENTPVIIFDDFTTATKYVDFPFKVKSSAMKILKPRNKEVNLRLVYELMQRIIYPMGIGDHKRHWIASYQNIEIQIPSTPEEQTHIATILSDMDADIAATERQLAKARSIKQGMMQQLLTGKIRLV